MNPENPYIKNFSQGKSLCTRQNVFLLSSQKPRDSLYIFDKIHYILVKDVLLVILLDLDGVHDPQKSDLPLHRVDRVPLILCGGGHPIRGGDLATG